MFGKKKEKKVQENENIEVVEETAASKFAKKRKKSSIKGILIVVGATTAYFVAMLVLKSTILGDNNKSSVYKVVKEIPAGEKITADNINTYLKNVEADNDYVPTGAVTDPNTIVNSFTTKTYVVNDIIAEDGFNTVEDITKDISNPIEVSFKPNAIADMTAGTLREGDRVNIYSIYTDSVRNGESGETHVASIQNIAKNAYISKAFSADGEALGVDSREKTAAAMLTIIIPQDFEEDFNLAVNYGTLKIDKIINPTNDAISKSNDVKTKSYYVPTK